jgi:hypothetical protein
LTNEQLSQLSHTVITALKDYTRELVQAELAAIPAAIREQLNPYIQAEIRSLARSAIADQLDITVKVHS